MSSSGLQISLLNEAALEERTQTAAAAIHLTQETPFTPPPQARHLKGTGPLAGSSFPLTFLPSIEADLSE